MRSILLRLGLLALIGSLAAPAAADTRITMRTHSDGLPEMGQPAVNEDSTLWFGEGVLREDKGNQSVIVNMKDSRLYVLKHDSSTFHSLDLPIDLTKMLPPEVLETYETLTAKWDMEVEIKPTDETREVAGYASRRHEVAIRGGMGMEMDLQLWTTDALDIDVAAFKRLTLEVSGLQPAGSAWIKKILAIEGFPVLKEVTVTFGGNSVKSTEELVAVDEATPPENTYRPPTDYSEEPFDLRTAMPTAP